MSWTIVDGILSTSSGGGALSPAQEGAVDSIVNAPDNEILVTGEGGTSGEFVSKTFVVDDAAETIDFNGYTGIFGTQSVNLGGALSIGAAGHTAALTDLIDNEITH